MPFYTASLALRNFCVYLRSLTFKISIMGEFIIVLLIVIIVFITLKALLVKDESDNTQSYTSNYNYDNENYVSEELVRNVPDRHKNCNTISVVGGFYRSWEAKTCIRELYAGETVFLKEEPDNPYDPNAIMVLSKKGLHIGYVSKYDILTVKNRMMEGSVKGSVYETMNSRYEYMITLQSMDDNEEYNNAIYCFNERKRIEDDAKKVERLRNELDFYNVIRLSVDDLVPNKKYASVHKLLKPIFDAGIQDSTCYELMIYCYHFFADYEAELQYIDKYIESGKVNDKGFINRRKYQVLRLIGHLVSNDQIENEKAGVETTILELDFFNRIVSLLSEVDPNRIDFRDSKGLFAVNLDNNIRRPICKLYLNNPDKMFIGLINDDGSVLKVSINDISELDDLKDDLIRPIKKFL